MTPAAPASTPPSRPVLIWDGACGFCRHWITRWQSLTGDQIEYLPFQDPAVAARFPSIPRDQFEKAVVLVEPDGAIRTAAAAVFRSLGRAPGWAWLWSAYARVPGLATITEAAYRFVARHRRLASALTPQPRPFAAGRWWFLRLLGLIYLAAFVSLWLQVMGLYGSHGVQPVASLMDAARSHFGEVNLARFPTVCWFGTSDLVLHLLCAAGTVLAVLVIADVAVTPALLGLWALYLSFCTVGDVFLSFQWDALLLETGLLAVLFAPGSRAGLWLLRWLLFRLMLASGVVKLSSGDAWWHTLTALTVHYETQPLPTWIGWWAHQLPAWFQQLSCAVMFGIELGAPFLIFAPRRPRLAAAAAITALMILIAGTGNYAFFNLLTVALCLTLLDDDALPRWAVRLGRGWPWRRHGPVRAAPWRRQLTWVLGLWLVLLSLPPLASAFRAAIPWPGWMHAFSAWRSVNGYGLFAVMTHPRYEIVIEGSRDGQIWVPYEFRHKPGDPARRPEFVAPHQPRLDWQMWFAALGDYRGNPWLLNLQVRLLQGEPAVLRLLATNPFPDEPPLLIRAVRYEYHFTDIATQRATGHWWRRELQGLYSPALERRSGP